MSSFAADVMWPQSVSYNFVLLLGRERARPVYPAMQPCAGIKCKFLVLGEERVNLLP